MLLLKKQIEKLHKKNIVDNEILQTISTMQKELVWS